MKLFFSLLTALMLAPIAARAQSVVFQDDFNSWDGSRWSVYDATRFLQRTQFGLMPSIGSESGTTYARFRLDTYDPDSAYRGSYLRGTQALSNASFSLGNGMEFEARVRGKNLPRGIVFAFFSYGDRGTWPDSYFKEEIDFEFLTNFAKNQLWLNIWDDWNPLRGGPNRATATSTGNLDWSGWNTYKIRWLNNATEWYVNGTLVRRSTDILPNDPMAVRFNVWAASAGWTTAYDANLKAATSSSANQSYYMDVDWVRVTALPPPPGAVPGNGSGLLATYYNNKDFTGATLSRIDPQVKFDWGQNSPDFSIGADTFSARWQGKVQAQYSENYTFTVRADDGVRLWINGQLLIDQWKDQGATEYGATLPMVAGRKYDLKLEYYEDGGNAVAQLYWSSAHTPKQFVPQIQLYPQLPDATPPTIGITAPVNGQRYRALTTVSGTASDNQNVAGVTLRLRDVTRNLYWNGAAWTATATDLAASGTTTWSYALPALADGPYTLTATAIDDSNNSAQSSVNFTMDASGPQITINAPQPNATYASLATASGTASDGAGVDRVWIRLWRPGNNTAWNGTTWLAATSLANSPNVSVSGTTNWSRALPSLVAASYFMQPVARDLLGNFTYGTPVRFTIAARVATARTSSVMLSSIAFNGDEITLRFTGALAAGDAAAWQVSVQGRAVPVVEVLTMGNSVTLRLPAGTLHAGDEISLAWPGLRDAPGRAVSGTWRGTSA